MTPLSSRDGIIENKIVPRRSGKSIGPRKAVFLSILVVITIILSSVLLVTNLQVENTYSPKTPMKVVSQNLGVGNTTPAIAVDPNHNVFAIAWYGYDHINKKWYLNLTLIGSTDGSLIGTTTISEDIATYSSYGKLYPSGMGPRIVWDSVNEVYLLIWYSQNKSIDGILLDGHGNPVSSPFVINGTVKVDYHAFGLCYNGKYFIVSWTDTSYRSRYRTISVDTSDISNPDMSDIYYLSKDTVRSHVNHASAWSSNLDQIGFVWRNSTGSSGKYNITMTVYSVDMSTQVYKDFTVANGLGDG